MTADESVERAVALLRGNPYGFLVTAGSSGEPHARLVQHLAVGDDAGIWIGTSPRSRKAADVAARPAVTYAVEDRTRFAYVAVSGMARLVADDAVRRSRWTDGLRPFFPGGPIGDDFVIIEIWTTRVELMDFTAGIHPDPYGLVPVIAVRGERWELHPAERRLDPAQPQADAHSGKRNGGPASHPQGSIFPCYAPGRSTKWSPR